MYDLISPYFEEAVRTALKAGRNGAIVAVGMRNQARIAKTLEGFFHVTADQILNNIITIPDGAVGLVVTGYTSHPVAMLDVLHSDEQKIEDWVADQTIEVRKKNPDFQVLVLTEKLPDTRIFKNQHYRWARWYPGLDEEAGQVFLLTNQGSPIAAHLILSDDHQRYIWVTKD